MISWPELCIPINEYIINEQDKCDSRVFYDIKASRKYATIGSEALTLMT